MSYSPRLRLAAIVVAGLAATEVSGQERAQATVAFRLSDKELVPEGIAYDPVSRRFFVSSVYKAKIVVVDAGSRVSSDFISERQHGFLGGLGLAVDAHRRTLWAASAMGSQTRTYEPELDGQSGLFRFSLEDGSLLGVYLPTDPPGKHLLNDLSLTRDGHVYVTDTSTGTIFALDPGSETLEPWLRSEELAFPNGICLSADETTMFVADDRGIAVVRRDDRSVRRLEPIGEIRPDGIDGLYCLDRELIAIQNHKGWNRVSRFRLDEAHVSITSIEVLLEDHPLFDIPTTGAIVDSAFFLIANSQLASYDRSGRLLPLDELHEPVVLRAPLQ